MMKRTLPVAMAIAIGVVLCGIQRNLAARAQENTTSSEQMETNGMAVKLMTLDPGHFHASLVQRKMYPQIDPIVHVYSNPGPDLQQHLARITQFNTRPDNPTRWVQEVYTEPDFLRKMITDKPGNVVVISGNNTRKTDYIMACVEAGLNVLADKPMAITPEDAVKLEAAFKVAEKNNVILYDIMSERWEITTMMQRELSRVPELFGELAPGTAAEPAVTKESVHHYYKLVNGKPLVRPAWFYDVRQEGEGIVDVMTHLVDLVQWECFPEQIIKQDEVKVLNARRWATTVTQEQFKKSTNQDQYPDFLKKDVVDGVLNVFGNGEFTYKIRGHYAKVSVGWAFEPPAGGGDTHYSIMRGSRADLIIKQNKEQNYKTTLYVENKSGTDDDVFDGALKAAISRIAGKYPGLEYKRGHGNWEIIIPDKYKTTHEQHFGEVTDAFLGFLAGGQMPKWEVPNMIVKYNTIAEAYKMSRQH